MAASGMDGLRSWKFEASGASISLEATDFWVDPRVELGSNGVDQLRSIALMEVWEHADTGYTEGLSRRRYMEDRVLALREFLGRRGTLTIDEDTDLEQVFTNITLLEVDPSQQGNNLLEYGLVFGYPVSSASGGSGIQLASKLEFGTESDTDLLVIRSDDMVIEFGDDGDKTEFKEIFRAAPIRVPGSLPLKVITVKGIVDRNLPSFWQATADKEAGAGYRANSLLDPTGTAYWKTTSDALPHYVTLYRGHFPLFKPARIGITPQTITKAPANFTVSGSDTGTSGWTTLLTVTGATDWVSGVEKTFDFSVLGNYKYLKVNVTAVADAGAVLEIKAIKLYPCSATVTDELHSADIGRRMHVADRLRALSWFHKGRQRQIRINNDVLLGTSEITAHLRDVSISDAGGLDAAAFDLQFVYGYGG